MDNTFISLINPQAANRQVLVGDRKVLDYVRHFAPSFMFAASGAPSCIAAAMAAFEVMQEEPWRLEKLRENYTYMKDELTAMGFELSDTESAIIPIYVRDNERTLEFWRMLLEDYAVYTNPFISPGVRPRHSLLRTSYMAKSRIAAFPFTTKAPVLGVVKSDYGDALVVADIPGLIEGAHEGRGLGDRFLRHVERTRMFLHIIDMAAVEGRDPVEDFHVIENELKSYSSAFAQRESFLVANKMDVPEAEANLVKFKRSIKQEIFEISAATGAGLKELVLALFKRLNR